MKHLTCSLLLSSFSLLAATTSQAQVTFSVGPKVGLNVATTRFVPDERSFSQGSVTTSNTSYRSGFEAGILGSIGFGHFQVQPAVLYSQKGFDIAGTQSNVISTDGTQPAPYQQTSRMSYLTVPINFTYAQHKNGQGLQVFAGPYLGILVNGNYTFTRPSTTLVASISGDIVGRARPDDFDGFTNFTLYSQRVDAGLQAGLGYQWGPVLVQAAYSMGLRNLTPSDYDRFPYLSNGPDYSNRVFQFSLAYLFGPKS